MRKNTQAVIEAFKQQQSKGNIGDSISTDGQTIFSYQTPIARYRMPISAWSSRLTPTILLDKSKYSHTTSTQQSTIRQSFSDVIEVDKL